jgi:prefoldin subunit 5
MAETHEHPLIMATRRLMSALDRLEKNLQQVSVTRDREVASEQKLSLFMRENETLLTERENLAEAFTRLTHQYQDLQQVAKSIHGKLDDSARRITQILEN